MFCLNLLEAKSGKDGFEVVKKLFSGVAGRELNIDEVNVHNVNQFRVRIGLRGQCVLRQAWSGLWIPIKRAFLRWMIRSQASQAARCVGRRARKLS